MKAIAALLVSVAVASGATASSALDVTVLPKPGFPLPAADVDPSGPRLELVSSKYRSPVLAWSELDSLPGRRLLWRSPALVANARTFVVTGNLIVAGYGFTTEPDFLYLLNRRNGKVLDRLPVPSAPETIKLRGSRLQVRTYDSQLVARIAAG